MKIEKLILNIVSAVVVTSSATTSHAALLAVDFGAAGAETGFVQQNATSAVHSTTAGTVTIALAGTQGIFNFATSGANDLLYRDFYFKNSGTITLTISGPGISASTAYDLRFWSYYGAEARNTTLTPSASTTGPSLGPISTSNAAPTGLDDSRYTTAGTYTSNGSGVITILVGGTGNRPAINAIQIDAVPEPSGIALLGLGGLGLCFRRRR